MGMNPKSWATAVSGWVNCAARLKKYSRIGALRSNGIFESAAERQRGHSCDLLKIAGKMGAAVKSGFFRHKGQREVCAQQQLLCLRHTHIENVSVQGEAGVLYKQSVQMVLVVSGHFGKQCVAQSLLIVRFHISYDFLHRVGCLRGGSSAVPNKLDENRFQQCTAIFPVQGLTGCKLLWDLAEQRIVFHAIGQE